ncbi:unnamed protein product [Caenorhabditis angaria]|uniref:ATP-dependent RNA helicase n=1 Tax=Caenorhabditis angaria TaxID=860376 RepID=A0A9P1MZ67_9PELO|nr:unnamed protein product [Caenorhabditis angaria]
MNEIKEEIKEEPMDEETTEKPFQVLGNRPMVNLEALKVTSSWVSNATTFSAKIDETTSQKLEEIELPEHLAAHSPIQKWFPVQYSVLPTLFKELQVPPAFRPRDVAIAAPTGSGKTICYVLPVLAAIGTTKSNILQAVILVPVQTLVKQIVDEFDRWNKEGYAKVQALSGANDFEKESKSLQTEPPNVIVATPARFVQHLVEKIPAKIDLTKLRYLIVDEADRMGKLMREEWLEIVEYLCGGMSRVQNLNDILRQRRAPQKIVLSATLSKDVEELHLWNLFKPRLFSATATRSKEISAPTKEINHVSGNLALPSSISHRLLICDAKYHPLAVYQHICRNEFNRTIIFVNEV